MEMICMDLIGLLLETSRGNKFALTVICLLTNYVFMIPIPNKSTQQVIQAYLKHICAQFSGNRYILTDRGSEFTSQLIHQLASELGFVKIFTSSYTPMGNSIIERAHQFLKHLISKIINDKQVEWDTGCHIAAVAFNVFPTRTDPYVPQRLFTAYINTISTAQAEIYRGQPHACLFRCCKELHVMNIMSLKGARDQDPPPNSKTTPPQFQIGDMVFINNHTKYMPS